MSISFSEEAQSQQPFVTSTSIQPEDSAEGSLRPRFIREYIGQEKAKDNLQVFIDAARMRGEPLDHVLLYGPPGLGKTTMAQVIANEMGVNMRITSGPTIEKAGDLAALLTNLQENDILFVDEIHRLNRAVEEILYPAMEDYAIDIIIGKGPSANSIRLASISVWSSTRPLNSSALWSAAPIFSALRSSRTVRPRSRPDLAARRESPTGCSSACATMHRSALTV